MLKVGNFGTFYLLLFLFVLTLLSIWLVRSKGMKVHVRRLAGIDAINEAIGRATELARPVHFTTGTMATLYGEEGPQILAGLSILSHIASQTAKYRTPLVVTVCHPSTLPLAEEIVRESYLKEGRADEFRPDMVRHLSTEQQAYASGVQGIFLREKVAANFMIGPLYADTLIIAETGYRVGAMQVGGTGTKTVQLPFLVAVCDYTLIGEEIFAAGAYISQNPEQLATMFAEDIAKFAVIALVLIGAIVTLFSKELLSLLKL